MDAVVTDPPYGIAFMGKEWDNFDADKVADRVEYDRQVSRGKPYASAAQKAGIYDISTEGNRRFQEWTRLWAVEALRVLKPGGHLLVCGGTRTYHRMVSGIEDAGFEIRDTIIWLYGSGFPKSLDVSKSIDKAAGAERPVVGENPNIAGRSRRSNTIYPTDEASWSHEDSSITDPVTPEAVKWQGWGTALKPGHEPIVVARKPFGGTVADTVLKYGTGALNIDACRVGGVPSPSAEMREAARISGKHPAGVLSHPDGDAVGRLDDRSSFEAYSAERVGECLGRWPANLILSHAPGCRAVGKKTVGNGAAKTGAGSPRSNVGVKLSAGNEDRSESIMNYGEESVDDYACASGCPVAELDRQSGDLARGHVPRLDSKETHEFRGWGFGDFERQETYLDSGGASRFFYIAKGARAERENGLGPPLPCLRCKRADEQGKPRHTDDDPHVYNAHPTVKPINLMRYLVRLVTPPGGTVLDPFAGSGTTLIAARLEGFNAVGIERDADYIRIAQARLAAKWIVEYDYAVPKGSSRPLTPPNKVPSLAKWIEEEE